MWRQRAPEAWIVLEKILEPGEQLRDWPIDGLTGYDFLATVTGVLTEHLRWPLRRETLYPDKTRGVSNELLDETASIAIEDGLLLVVHRRA